MAVIDPTTDLGKIRLRIADVGDIPYLSDLVIQTTLTDSDNNLLQAAKTCAMYILGMLAHKTRRRLNQLEVYGSDAFKQYSEFLLLTISNPAFMSISPVPYSSSLDFEPITNFQSDWNKAYCNGTESQQLANIADNSANDGSRTGGLFSNSGWMAQ